MVAREGADDERFQDAMLKDVSRTFALTIPELPRALRTVVGNGYLLCRIVDTIEDDPGLSSAQKRRFCTFFAQVVARRADPAEFARGLDAVLAPGVPEAERLLVRETARVIAISEGFTAGQRKALEACVAIMADGMAEFQERKDPAGLPTLADMDRYCYYVAGVVGEMLTRLFCEYSPAMRRHEERLMTLAVSFGQTLQMTNILKDIWEDHRRGACWLPRDVFARHGFALSDLENGPRHAGFAQGLGELIDVARSHARLALEYILLIPREEEGLRNFCLWALGMAILTLRKIDSRRDFASGQDVKITRRSVKATVAVSRFSAGHDRLLRLLFVFLAGMPRPLPRGA
ncbi:phytoene/squalene synthase family protein [Acidiferrobacter sp.]|uniref:phytoene/squalene synthase family protein n=1 Tax=Acidiferrobacter sp. TaxID=1872107 RepID=UPI002623C2DE|nr:phytoene/squalene synthase family protein [Acidiferrobacter sp.]